MFEKMVYCPEYRTYCKYFTHVSERCTCRNKQAWACRATTRNPYKKAIILATAKILFKAADHRAVLERKLDDIAARIIASQEKTK